MKYRILRYDAAERAIVDEGNGDKHLLEFEYDADAIGLALEILAAHDVVVRHIDLLRREFTAIANSPRTEDAPMRSIMHRLLH